MDDINKQAKLKALQEIMSLYDAGKVANRVDVSNKLFDDYVYEQPAWQFKGGGDTRNIQRQELVKKVMQMLKETDYPEEIIKRVKF